MRGPKGTSLSRRLRVTLAAICLGVAVPSGIAACGDSRADDHVAVKVKNASITTATIARWMRALAPEHVMPEPPRYRACIAHQEEIVPGAQGEALRAECVSRYRELRRRTVSFMISRAWLLDEGREEGIGPSRAEVAERVASTTFPTGVTGADRQLAAEATLVEARLRGNAAALGRSVAKKDVSAFYGRHINEYERPEKRYINIVERLPTRARAELYMREVKSGHRRLSMWNTYYHEAFDTRSIAEAPQKRKSVFKSIFSALPHLLVGPEVLNEYSVFEVTRIVPRHVTPLSKVASGIRRRLESAGENRALARFVKAWARKWRGKTDCRPGYVVPQCLQYHGFASAEEDAGFT
jgi:foldase protein PrsA